MMPEGQDSQSLLGQLLLEQGKQSTNIALIQQKLDSMPISDHESRLRALERFRFTIAGASVFGGALSGFVGYWVGHLVR